MPNIFVIFPSAKLTEATNYKNFGDAWFQNLSGEEQGILGLLNEDAHGQWVTTFAGPPFVWDSIRGAEPEPSGGPAMRADGVLAVNWDRPDEEE